MKLNILISTLIPMTALARLNDGAEVPSDLLEKFEELKASTEDDRDLLSDENKIIGGFQASSKQFPFFVQGRGCGASLVAPDVVCSRKSDLRCMEIKRSSYCMFSYMMCIFL